MAKGVHNMKNITMIEEHLYENKNGSIRTEYRIYKGLVYSIKTKSQLTKTEKEWLQKNGIAEVFHF